MSQRLSIEELREWLDYNPTTGEFFWKQAKRGIHVGMRAGTTDSRWGYRVVRFQGVFYRCSRLAFAFTYDRWPREIDHVNRVRDDDRICNLREATRSLNMGNAGKSKNNKSGRKGVSARRGKWRAVIMLNRKQHHLGDFETVKEAHAAYAKAARMHFGDFACACS